MVWAPSSHMAWVATSPRRTQSLARNSNCARAWRSVSFGTNGRFVDEEIRDDVDLVSKVIERENSLVEHQNRVIEPEVVAS